MDRVEVAVVEVRVDQADKERQSLLIGGREQRHGPLQQADGGSSDALDPSTRCCPAQPSGRSASHGLGITIGWAVAQKPYLLPGELTVDQAAAPDTTLTALVVGVGLGLILLVPSLWWLYRLVLQGRLDQEYEPIDQRFQP